MRNNKKLSPSAFIFDYGGTLDTRGNHWGKVIWHAYEKAEVPVTEEQYRDAYVYAERTLGRNPIIKPEHTFHDVLKIKLELQFGYLFENNMIGADAMTLREQIVSDLYNMVCEIVAESRAVLQELKHQGYPLVLVSNFYGNLATVLSEFHLDNLFDSLIESSVVGIRKPDPQIFALGVEKLGLSPAKVMVVGDSMSKDIVPAKSIGCITAWYKGEPWSDIEESGDAADIVITSLKELTHKTTK